MASLDYSRVVIQETRPRLRMLIYLAKIKKYPLFLSKSQWMHFSISVNLQFFCDLQDIGGQHARKIATSFLPIWELSKQEQFLAHLSRRLTRWAYSIAMVRRPSVVVRRRPSASVVVRRRPSSSVVHTFKLEYLWSHLANLDQILCVASLGWGKGCIMFWGRLDQNSGFHGNRKPPLTYNGENDVSTFSRLFLIGSFLYLQVTRTCIKSRTSSNFHQIGPLTTELAALERLKNFP